MSPYQFFGNPVSFQEEEKGRKEEEKGGKTSEDVVLIPPYTIPTYVETSGSARFSKKKLRVRSIVKETRTKQHKQPPPRTKNKR